MDTEENGLDIVRAYDTIYGFILAQEVHVRAELFQNLDVLYHWARKHSPDSAETAETNPGPAALPEDASTANSD